MRRMENAMHHPTLFLITDCDGGIMLSSYEIPAGEDKNTFFLCFHEERRI